jgi:preprotein translocase subunit SecB
MSAVSESQFGSTTVRVIGPDLWSAHFDRIDLDALPSAPVRIGTEHTVNLYSSHKQHLLVELETTINGAQWLEIKVVHRIGFIIRGVIDDGDRRQLLRDLGSRVAPQTLLPFARQAIMSLTQQSGLPSLTIPLLDIATDFTDVEIPESDVPAPGELTEPDADSATVPDE